MPKPVSQSTQHIMMTEPLGFLSNPQTMETNTYQEENATDLRSIQDHARAEFRLFRDRLVEAGVVVTTVLGHPDSPDDVFATTGFQRKKTAAGRLRWFIIRCWLRIGGLSVVQRLWLCWKGDIQWP
jgi:hypothetical protein